jgi:hypothetical protein
MSTDTHMGSVVACGHDAAGEQMIADLLDADDHDIVLDHYTAARSAGSTHEEILEAHGTGFDMGAYCAVLQSGATHGEALEVFDSEFSYLHYAAARNVGVTHDEAMAYRDTASEGYEFDGMINLRSLGATHDELMEYLELMARSSTFQLGAVASHLRGGTSMHELLVILARGVRPNELPLAQPKPSGTADYGPFRGGWVKPGRKRLV